MKEKSKKTSEKTVEEALFTVPPNEIIVPLEIRPETKTIYENWGLTELNITSLWKFTKGKGIKIAVLDTGLEFDHPEFENINIENENFINPGTKAYDDHQGGHGTHTAGIIAARNREIEVGVAPEAQLFIGKVLDNKGKDKKGSLKEGICWAIEQKVDIINMSLAGNKPESEVHDEIQKAVDKGIFVVCAAGNSGPAKNSVQYPAKYSQTVAVGAIDSNRRIFLASSRGPEIHIVAPGVKILSTYRLFRDNNYANSWGTSVATGFVTGVLALFLAGQRKCGKKLVNNHTQLIKLLKDTSTDLGIPDRDNDFGFGLINPEKLFQSLN